MANIYRALRHAKALAKGEPKVSANIGDMALTFTVPFPGGNGTPLQASFSVKELLAGIEFGARCFRDVREGYRTDPVTDADILQFLRWK